MYAVGILVHKRYILSFQVLNAAWDVCIPVSSENALLCHNRVGYNKILDNSKPLTNPDGRHLSSFTYLRLSTILMERHNFMEFDRFVKRMHGTTSSIFSLPFFVIKSIQSISKHSASKNMNRISLHSSSAVTFHFRCRGSCSRPPSIASRNSPDSHCYSTKRFSR